MGSVALWLISKGIPARMVKPLLIGGVVLLLVAGAVLMWEAHDRKIIKQHDDTIAAETAVRAAPAIEQAAQDRANETILINTTETEAHHAVAQAPESAPSAAAIALGCNRLRRAGQDITRLPACRRLGSSDGGQARADR